MLIGPLNHQKLFVLLVLKRRIFSHAPVIASYVSITSCDVIITAGVSRIFRRMISCVHVYVSSVYKHPEFLVFSKEQTTILLAGIFLEIH